MVFSSAAGIFNAGSSTAARQAICMTELAEAVTLQNSKCQ
jgi:hypothetical protein